MLAVVEWTPSGPPYSTHLSLARNDTGPATVLL